jgi:hypothetical protein
MDHLQENINNPWNMADNSIRRPFKCVPLHTHPLYESEYMDCDNSNKVLMPESILTILSGYDNFEYPIIFKIKDAVMGVQELIHSDSIYIPHYICEKIGLTDEKILFIEILNYKPYEKAEFLKLKPYQSDFYEVFDVKGFLEKGLKKYYTHIEKGEVIKLNYQNKLLKFDVIETKPDGIISLIETNVEVDFEQAHDYKPVVKPRPLISLNFNFPYGTGAKLTPILTYPEFSKQYNKQY